ncbi:unnamed protein product [Urochloa humidicola]
MAAPTTTAVLSMKLLIDTKSQRVLFAEAGKDVVDFLFSLLALPLAAAAALLRPEGSIAGSVGTLYARVERLDDKGDLLRPALAASPAATSSSSLLLPLPPSAYGGWWHVRKGGGRGVAERRSRDIRWAVAASAAGTRWRVAGAHATAGGRSSGNWEGG